MDTEKLIKLETKVLYDQIADVLYISYGKPRPAISTEVSEGDLVRTDPKTSEVVGITIIDFKERYRPAPTASIQEFAQKIIPQVMKEFRDIPPSNHPQS